MRRGSTLNTGQESVLSLSNPRQAYLNSFQRKYFYPVTRSEGLAAHALSLHHSSPELRSECSHVFGKLEIGKVLRSKTAN